MKFTPRPYQQEVFKNSKNLISSSSLLGVITVPAGGGKTKTAKMIIEDMPNIRFAFLVPKKNLADQTHKEFSGAGLYYSGKRVRGTSNVDIFVNKTFKRLMPKNIGRYQVVFIDEAHIHEGVAEYIAKVDPSVTIIGMTATPFKGDGTYLNFFNANAKQLTPTVWRDVKRYIMDGYLCPLKMYQVHNTPLGENEIVERGADFSQDTLDLSVERVTDIPKSSLTYIGEKKTIVVATNIKQCDQLFKEYSDLGISCRILNYKVKDPQSVIDSFRRGEFQVIITVDMITTGTDIPDAEVLVLARMINNLALFRQLVGRVMRLADGKSNGVLLDFFGNIERLGSPLEHIEPSDNPTKKKSLKCEFCGSTECKKILVSEKREDSTVYREFIMSKCRETLFDFKDDEVAICEGCGLTYEPNVIQIDKGSHQESHTLCPECGHKNILSIIEKRELIEFKLDRARIEELEYSEWYRCALFMDDIQYGYLVDVLKGDSYSSKSKQAVINRAGKFKVEYSMIVDIFIKNQISLSSLLERDIGELINEKREEVGIGHLIQMINKSTAKDAKGFSNSIKRIK